MQFPEGSCRFLQLSAVSVLFHLCPSTSARGLLMCAAAQPNGGVPRLWRKTMFHMLQMCKADVRFKLRCTCE
eukprot:7735988-Alexandrium_andersonii.AAC.1